MTTSMSESGASPPKLQSIDQEFTRFTSRVFPYSVNEVWPYVTENYVELQQFIHSSQDTASPVRAVPNTPNGVGGVIEFDWNGQRVLEKLVEQDDQKYVWSIQVPGETNVFKRYAATLSFVPITDTSAPAGSTLATLELKMVLQKPETAPKVFPSVDALVLQRLPRLEEYIQQKHGYQTMTYAEDVTVPTDKLWSVISNWNDISWVLGSESVKVDPKDPYLREISFKGGYSIQERLVSKNDDSRTIVYQMLKSSFPVSYYRATLNVGPKAGGKSSFEYNLLFKPTGPADQASKAVLDRLKAGVQFINSNLGGRS